MITRETIIQHILKMKLLDPDYAREALKYYNRLLPWMNLNDGIREALNDKRA